MARNDRTRKGQGCDSTDVPTKGLPATSSPDANTELSESEVLPSSKVLATVLSATGVSAAVGAIHFIGHCAHVKWMSHWGYESQQIPLDTTDKFVLGYSAVFDGFTTAVTATNLEFAAQLTGLLALLGLATFGAVEAGKRLQQKTRVKETLLRVVPRWLQISVLICALSACVVTWLYCAALSIATAMAIGPAIGSSFGQISAQRDEERVKQGCKRAKGHAACTEMKRDDKVIANGVLLAASDSHVLIYDVNAKKPLLLPTEGAQFAGWQE